MSDRELRVLSAGAARALVHRVQGEFESAAGVTVVATFGPVGVVRAAVRGDDASDVVITSAPEMAFLVADGLLASGGAADLGAVPTALAVREPDPAPDLAAGLESVLTGADAVYCPDLERSTAGAHVLSVLERMGIREAVRPRLRVFPHGAAAMAALATSTASAPIGCTQLTEILATPGVRAVGEVPAPWSLRTVYRVARLARAAEPEWATRFAEVLTATRQGGLRASLGFLPADPGGPACRGTSAGSEW